MRLRSLLFVPGDRPERFAKAAASGADAIILDLEDSVLPAQKEVARANLAEAVPSAARNGAKVFVRINADPDLQQADAEAACRAGAFGLYVAKARDSEALSPLSQLLDRVERAAARGRMALVPLLEDPGAVLDARELARHERVLGLASGGEDLALGMGGEPLPEVLRLPKLMVHLAAKAEGKLSFGTLATVADYSDLDALSTAAREAKRHGFDGASCIHPSAVPILNEAFSPSAEQVSWARRVVDAAKIAGEGAFTLDDRMIDAPVLARARAVLAQAGE